MKHIEIYTINIINKSIFKQLLKMKALYELFGIVAISITTIFQKRFCTCINDYD